MIFFRMKKYWTRLQTVKERKLSRKISIVPFTFRAFILKFIWYVSNLNFLTINRRYFTRVKNRNKSSESGNIQKNILCLIVNKTMGNFLVQLLWLWIDFCWISPKVIFHNRPNYSVCILFFLKTFPRPNLVGKRFIVTKM